MPIIILGFTTETSSALSCINRYRKKNGLFVVSLISDNVYFSPKVHAIGPHYRFPMLPNSFFNNNFVRLPTDIQKLPMNKNYPSERV